MPEEKTVAIVPEASNVLDTLVDSVVSDSLGTHHETASSFEKSEMPLGRWVTCSTSDAGEHPGDSRRWYGP